MVKLTIKLVKNSPCRLIELPGAEEGAEFNKALSVKTNSAAYRLLRARFA